MCYAIPGRVLELRGKLAVIDYFGEKRTAVNEFEKLKPGDYVYAQGGIVVEKISAGEAEPILEHWKGRFFELKEIDMKLSDFKGTDGFFGVSEKPEKDEFLRILKASKKEEMDSLFRAANSLRKKSLKNACCVHGIIEFSNHCRKNCLYCGIRKGNKTLPRYRMGPEEIIKRAEYAVKELGFRALVLQSGEDEWYTTEKLVEIIRGIRERCGVLLFMSVGSREKECYEKMYEAGARGVLLRFESSNPELYEKMRSGESLEERIELIKYCRELGYIIATGSLIGLPGQTEEDLLNDVLLTKELGAEMYSFGPLIPHKDTPLAEQESPDINTVLKILAVSRFADLNAKILVTTALETLDPSQGRRKGLLAGANSLMINVTPGKYREKYEIYPGRPDRGKDIKENIAGTLRLLYSLGRAPTDLGM